MASSVENVMRSSAVTGAPLPSALDPIPPLTAVASSEHLQVISHSSWLEVVLDNGPNNYLDQATVSEITSLLMTVSRCEYIKCVVFSGGDKRAFSRGLDLKSFSASRIEDQVQFIQNANVLLSRMAQATVPVICAINGACIGAGLELAVACDFRIASENATFSAPEVVFGLVPGGGVLQRLLRQLGRGQCMRLLSSGLMITAGEALRIGLIEEVVEPERLSKQCEYVARRLARAPRSALVAMKRSVVEGLDLPMSATVQSDLLRSIEALQLGSRYDGQRPGEQQQAPQG